MENNINEIFNQKDKRISYLSILHSLAILHQGQNLSDEKLSEFATKLTDNLFVKYPTPGEKPMETQPKNFKPLTDNCPICNAPMKYREGTAKSGNKWRGQFCTKKGCKGVVWLPKSDEREVSEGFTSSEPQ